MARFVFSGFVTISFVFRDFQLLVDMSDFIFADNAVRRRMAPPDGDRRLRVRPDLDHAGRGFGAVVREEQPQEVQGDGIRLHAIGQRAPWLDVQR